MKLQIGAVVHGRRVLAESDKSASGDRFWIVTCSTPGCEVVSRVIGSSLRRGASKHCATCGIQAGRPPALLSAHIDSPHYRRLYGRMNSAIQRCTNPKQPHWADYGGRGITVYQAWLDDPGSFLEYLFTLPGHDDPKLQLDRKDNDGHYEPGNLRFTRAYVNSSNRRSRRTK